VVVTEAPRTCSFASEVAASVAERGLLSLLAPIERVTAWDAVTPLARLEGRYVPSRRRIAAAVRRVLEFA
jgi:pyruvate dehydrogenase E1 component beta subunit